MSEVNPDPHQAGYVYQPTNAVTAFFPPGSDPQAAVRELSDAGFTQERVNVFTGEQGASQLDVSGVKHGAWVQFRRALEQVFADEADVYTSARQGSSMPIMAKRFFTGGNGRSSGYKWRVGSGPPLAGLRVPFPGRLT
jgi:hypothetical protein